MLESSSTLKSASPLFKEKAGQKIVANLKDINLSFGSNQVLKNVNLTLVAGEKVALVGESSCGKSSLLKTLAGLIAPDTGEVSLFGHSLNKIAARDLRAVRQRIGMQFQSGALFDSLTVLENLKLARVECAKTPAAEKAAREDQEPMALLAAVGLAKAAHRAPHALSGGMRKRAALARALTTHPDLAIFDEPTAGLDPVTSRRIINLIEKLSSHSGATMILATTDVEVARRFSPDIIIMNEGRLWARGTVEELLTKNEPFIQKLFSRLL